MQTEVIPLSTIAFNWIDFLKVCNDLLQSSPTRKLDEHNVQVGPAASLLSTLHYFQGGTATSPRQAILESGALKDHIYFGFLIHTDKDTMIELLQRTNLKVTSAPVKNEPSRVLLVVTGTLLDWHLATLELCQSAGTRYIGNQIVVILESIGFAAIWAGYNKRPMTNGFLLEKK
jgi:hypothetical protein